METYKTGTVNTIINENGVDLGSINVNLYTMDNKTSVICLLYTSPSPRDGLLSRMPSSA